MTGDVLWERDGCQLVLGDGPEVLASLSDVRAVITDPPYACLHGADIAIPGTRIGYIRLSASWEITEDEWVTLMTRLTDAASQAVVNGWVHVWCAAELTGRLRDIGQSMGLRYRQFYVMAKTNPAPRIRVAQWQSAVEVAAVFGGEPDEAEEIDWAGVFSAGQPRFEGNHRNFFECPCEPASNRYHETQKPLVMVRHLVERYTQPGDLVVDTCGGSCNILTACMETGRRCVAIEADPDIAECARLAYTEGLRAARLRYAQRGGLSEKERPGQMTFEEAS